MRDAGRRGLPMTTTVLGISTGAVKRLPAPLGAGPAARPCLRAPVRTRVVRRTRRGDDLAKRRHSPARAGHLPLNLQSGIVCADLTGPLGNTAPHWRAGERGGWP